MKFARVNGQRQEAQPNLSGECLGCGAPMVAKCGNIRLWHWAHKAGRVCDRWWEAESEWHRAWKNNFPVDWQEVVHHAEDGELHIADVKTNDGWFMEFQHSNISSEERRSREAFYKCLVWVVDGTRRQRDAAQFSRAYGNRDNGKSPDPFSSKRKISLPEGALLRDWAGSHAHVFFDFGDPQSIWWLFPQSDDQRAYVQSISRGQFVRALRDTGLGEFDALVDNFRAFVAGFESPPPTHRPKRPEKPPYLNPMRVMRRGPRL